MTQKQIKYLFFFSFVAMMIVYILVFGKVRTIMLLIDEYIFVLSLIPLWLISLWYKRKLRRIELIDFHQDSGITLKTTVVFFLLFQVIDYVYEGGFIGMISQWFLYWIMGFISFMVLTIVNYHKNYKYLKLQGLK